MHVPRGQRVSDMNRIACPIFQLPFRRVCPTTLLTAAVSSIIRLSGKPEPRSSDHGKSTLFCNARVHREILVADTTNSRVRTDTAIVPRKATLWCQSKDSGSWAGVVFLDPPVGNFVIKKKSRQSNCTACDCRVYNQSIHTNAFRIERLCSRTYMINMK